MTRCSTIELKPVHRRALLGVCVVALAVIVLAAPTAPAGDWPTWRHDAGRGSATPDPLPAELHLNWVLPLGQPRPAWPASQLELQYDAGYEPVAAGQILLVGSNANDSLTAYETRSGKEVWRFFADGPIRFALTRIGDRWQQQRDGILIEHRAIDACLQILNLLRGTLPPPDPDAPVAVGCAPTGDPYVLPSLMAAMTLAESGMRDVNLGANTPMATLRAAIERASALAAETKRAIERAGIECPVITGAGTGTWQLERDSHVYTELQPGSYVFMDADYARNALAPDEHAFEHSLYVLASVMSVPTAERAVVDAGLKALAVDSGLPQVHAARGLRYAKASDEHGVLDVDTAQAHPAIGDRVWLIPGHCDPTVNLYDWLVGMRGQRVECVWPVGARGAVG